LHPDRHLPSEFGGREEAGNPKGSDLPAAQKELATLEEELKNARK